MRSQIKILEEEVLRFKVSVDRHHFKMSKGWKAELFPSSASKLMPNDDTNENKDSCSVIYMPLVGSYNGLQARRRH